MKVYGIRCKKCGDIIYSRTRHDMRWCSCHSCAIDGGFDYLKVTGDPKQIEDAKLELDVTKEDLYSDWNLSENRFGRMPSPTLRADS